MKTWNKYAYCYLFCFMLVVVVDLLNRSSAAGVRMYMVLMPLLALSIVLLSDFRLRGVIERGRKYRWSILALLLGIGTSFFLNNTLYAGGVILASAFVAPCLRSKGSV